MAISSNHFAAPGKRVASAHDESQRGTVALWLSDPNDVVQGVGSPEIIVKWDGLDFATACYTFDLEPLEDAPVETPAPITLDAAVEAVKASCTKYGMPDYDGEAVAFLDALLAVGRGADPDDAVRNAYGVHTVEIVQMADGDQPEQVVKSMYFGIERQAQKAENGANINLDHERYFTRIV